MDWSLFIGLVIFGIACLPLTWNAGSMKGSAFVDVVAVIIGSALIAASLS